MPQLSATPTVLILTSIPQTIPNVPWYTDRQLTNVTLGGLIILVVIRTLQINISTMRVCGS